MIARQLIRKYERAVMAVLLALHVNAFANEGVFAECSVPEEMVFIQGGTNSGIDPDFGAYSLAVDSFCMDRFEVSKSLWDEVCSWATSNGYIFDNQGTGKDVNHPVQTVNWYDCVKWSNARSQKEGREPAYYTNSSFSEVYKTGRVQEPYVKALALGYRLPKEIEWEYAARGGVTSRRFSWSSSDKISHQRANYHGYYYDYDEGEVIYYNKMYIVGAFPFTSPVGSFNPNGYGLYDMTGNVWEWCWDWHPTYVGSRRMLRGGAWYTHPDLCRVAVRHYNFPEFASITTGFRLILPVSGEE